MLDRLTYPIALFSKSMKFSTKFMVILLISALPTIYLQTIYTQNLYTDVKQDKTEIKGIYFVEKLSSLLRAIGIHARQTEQFLNGDTGLLEQIQAEENQTAHLIGGIKEDIQQNFLELMDPFKKLNEKWDRSKEWSRQTLTENAKNHLDLVGTLLDFFYLSAANCSLFLDPDPIAYYEISLVVDTLPTLNQQLFQTALLIGRAKSELNSALYFMKVQERALMLQALLKRINSALSVIEKDPRSNNAFLSPLWQEVNKTLSPLIDKILSEGPTEFLATKEEVSKTFSTTLLDAADIFRNKTARHIREILLNKRLDQQIRSLTLNLVFGIGMILFSFWIVLGFSTDIRSRVIRFAKHMEHIQWGDFTQKLPVEGSDELEQISERINSVSDNIGNMFAYIQADARELLKNAKAINSASTEVSRSAVQQSDAAQNMAMSIEQMSAHIGQISDHATDASRLATQAGQTANQGSGVIQRSADKVRNIAQTVGVAAQKITALGTQVQQISGIVDVIKGIAEQTNLLALNAAIEAARAGESGRGFAVVADEVRKLAGRTASSTTEISNMISSIQSGTLLAVQSMERGTQEISEGVQLAEEAGLSIQQISTTSEHVVHDATKISTQLVEQVQSAKDIRSRIDIIADGSEKTSATATHFAALASQLENMAFQLEIRLKAFQFLSTDRPQSSSRK